MKSCTKCKALKESTDFFSNKRAKDGLTTQCRVCLLAGNADWRKRHPDRVLKSVKNWAKANQEKLTYQYLYRYWPHLKPAERKAKFLAMLDTQNGMCQICHISSTLLNVDHNHTTGEIRGLLCNQCNAGIGCLKESETNLLNAIEYLKRYTFSVS